MFYLKIFFVLFRNCYFQNVFLTFLPTLWNSGLKMTTLFLKLLEVVHINVEICNIDSMLFDVVNSNVEIHNIISTLIWRCPTLRRRINQKTTMKQRWNVSWVYWKKKILMIKQITSFLVYYHYYQIALKMWCTNSFMNKWTIVSMTSLVVFSRQIQPSMLFLY